jgi:hypothetical protein
MGGNYERQQWHEDGDGERDDDDDDDDDDQVVEPDHWQVLLTWQCRCVGKRSDIQGTQMPMIVIELSCDFGKPY